VVTLLQTQHASLSSSSDSNSSDEYVGVGLGGCRGLVATPEVEGLGLIAVVERCLE